jgi:hypothetical protein
MLHEKHAYHGFFDRLFDINNLNQPFSFIGLALGLDGKFRNMVTSKTIERLALTTEWFLDLRTLVSDTVSLVEITLNQLYLKAEYDPLPGWKFDREKLGNRHGRRFKDKLAWV